MHTVSIVILVGLLLLASYRDICEYRISNKLILFGLAVGISLNVILPQEIGGLGFQLALAGAGVGVIVFLPMYLIHAMGAGDIKLMAMVGAFVGPSPMLQIALYVAIAGGLLALIVLISKSKLIKPIHNYKLMLMRNQLSTTAGNLDTISTSKVFSKTKARLPYGVAIAAGTFFYLITNF